MGKIRKELLKEPHRSIEVTFDSDEISFRLMYRGRIAVFSNFARSGQTAAFMDGTYVISDIGDRGAAVDFERFTGKPVNAWIDLINKMLDRAQATRQGT